MSSPDCVTLSDKHSRYQGNACTAASDNIQPFGLTEFHRSRTAIVLVWPTSWTPAVGGLFVCECMCECVYPRTCRRMMNG